MKKAPRAILYTIVGLLIFPSAPISSRFLCAGKSRPRVRCVTVTHVSLNSSIFIGASQGSLPAIGYIGKFKLLQTL
jgi:hypothetical protein